MNETTFDTKNPSLEELDAEIENVQIDIMEIEKRIIEAKVKWNQGWYPITVQRDMIFLKAQEIYCRTLNRERRVVRNRMEREGAQKLEEAYKTGRMIPFKNIFHSIAKESLPQQVYYQIKDAAEKRYHELLEETVRTAPTE